MTVARCMAEGLASGKGFATDAWLIKVDATSSAQPTLPKLSIRKR